MRATNGRLVKVATCFEDQAPSLADLNDDELAARRDEVQAQLATLSSTEDLTDEQVDEMEALNASFTAIRAEFAIRVAASLTAPELVEAPAEVEAEVVEPEVVEEEAVVEAPVEALVASAPAPVTRPAPVAAARPRRVVTAPEVRNARLPLYAAADVPGFVAGAEIDLAKMSDAFVRRAMSLKAPRGGSFSNRYGIAQLQKTFDPRAIVKGNDAEEVLNFVSNEANTPKGSLTASGGWCAPSETLYELAAQVSTTEGLYSLPEVLAARGGFNTTLGPDFASIYSDTGFCFTEGQDVLGDYNPDESGAQGKPCFKVECPDFTETRLDVCGICISAGYLQTRAYPEMTQRTISEALVAHQHRLAGRILADVIAGSDPVDAVNLDPNPGALAPILDAIELQVLDMRYRHRMSPSRTLEAVFPLWVHGLVRADLSRRLGVDLLSVPNARINAWFAERGVSPQFVYNFDDLGGVAAASGYPSVVRFALYPAGSWIRASSDVIDLGVVHDSTQFAFNNYTAMFTEEGWAVIKRFHDSRVVSVNVCPSGVTGAGENLICSSESPA